MQSLVVHLAAVTAEAEHSLALARQKFQPMQNGSGTLLRYISESPVVPNEPVVGAIWSVVFKSWTPADRLSPLAPGAARLTGCQRVIYTSGRSKKKDHKKKTHNPAIWNLQASESSWRRPHRWEAQASLMVSLRHWERRGWGVNYINPKQINGWQCLKGCGKGLEIEWLWSPQTSSFDGCLFSLPHIGCPTGTQLLLKVSPPFFPQPLSFFPFFQSLFICCFKCFSLDSVVPLRQFTLLFY